MDVIAEITAALAGAAAAVGLIVTTAVGFLKQSFDRGDEWPAAVWSGAAVALGVGLCLLYEIDALSALAAEGPTRAQSAAGQALTGLLAAGGSKVWHNLLKRINPEDTSSKASKRKNPAGH